MAAWQDEQGRRGIKYKDWNVESRKSPILNASEVESASDKVGIPLPEICFGNNGLKLSHQPSGFSYDFDALEALEAVDPTGEAEGSGGIKVAHAEEWARSRNLIDDGQGGTVKVARKFDWTYTTDYPGTVRGPFTFKRAGPNDPGIPLEKLAQQNEPILFYDEVSLFEDELHDCGVANLTIKIRVMPSSFFVLSRFFLRVDRVLFRIFDVRIYHEFGSKSIVRECRGREASYGEVQKRLPPEKSEDLTPLTDPNWVANALGMLDQSTSVPPTMSSVASSPTTATSVQAYLAQQPTARRSSISLQSAPPPAIPRTDSNAKGSWKGLGTVLETINLPT